MGFWVSRVSNIFVICRVYEIDIQIILYTRAHPPPQLWGKVRDTQTKTRINKFCRDMQISLENGKIQIQEKFQNLFTCRVYRRLRSRDTISRVIKNAL